MFVKLNPFQAEIDAQKVEVQRGVWLDKNGGMDGVSVNFALKGEKFSITFQWPDLEMEKYCHVDVALADQLKKELMARKDETMRLLTERLAMNPEALFDLYMQNESEEHVDRDDAMGFFKREFGIDDVGSESSSLCLSLMRKMKLQYDDLKAFIGAMRQYPEFQYISSQTLMYALKYANMSVPTLVERLHERFNEECEDGPNNEWDPDKNPDYEDFLVEQYMMY